MDAEDKLIQAIISDLLTETISRTFGDREESRRAKITSVKYALDAWLRFKLNELDVARRDVGDEHGEPLFSSGKGTF